MTRLYCPNSDTPKEVELDEIMKGQFKTCDKCAEEFNLFGIYKFLYESISLAKKIVDILSSNIYAKIRFEGGEEKDLEKLERFRKDRGFDSLLGDVVFDTILYGNSFVEKVGKDKGFLRRIDPTTIEVVTSWQQRPPFKSYSVEIDKIIQHVPDKAEIQRDVLVHFVWNNISSPLGSSVLGFWFDDWYNVAFRKASPITQWREPFMISASQVPYYLIHPEVKYRNQIARNLENRLFSTNVKLRRKSISRVVEREILPIILARPFDFKNYPRLIFL